MSYLVLSNIKQAKKGIKFEFPLSYKHTSK